ncbi:uncharacterized protein LOC122250197 isoform X2 [Penaeus japonicus]|uniref:uncharacterized protein LOC122250197 isoform X2 n=1 Tax=Penaeus japonicus TaxID=27405 RepID=UPI001C70F60C|nr:uncharacterized protein LOC122250197 isoform X2 [Penaeus japonicus]
MLKMLSREHTCVSAIVILGLLVTACGSEQHERNRRSHKTSLSNKFIGVTSKCTRGTLTVDVRTQDPFYGSVYARGYPGRCKVSGVGGNTTSLIVSAQKCGVKVIEDEIGDHTYELLVYIQFDKWVQQVIDEQVHVRCRLERDAGELKAVAQMNVVSNDPELDTDVDDDGNSDPATAVSSRSNSRSSSRGSSSSSGRSKLVTLRNKVSSLRSRAQDGGPVEEWEPLPLPSELLQWQKNRPEGNSEPVSCWMDIVRGDSLNGKPVMDHLLVGDDTTMVLKVRQSKGLDTRITSCVAHDGSGEQAQDLIDEHGCAVDDTIMPPLRIKSNPKTGVKVAHSTFKAFKFPDRDNLHLRCTVLVCLGSCNLPVCGRTSNRVGRRMGGVGQGSIQPVEDLQELFSDITQRDRSNERALTGRVLDKVEVFNAVEVRAPGIESQPDLVKQYRIDREKVEAIDFFSEENMFCVTPYKMVLAFGVLLAIMLVALLFALYSCVKARMLKAPIRAPPPIESHRHSPVAAPYYRFAH